MLGADWIDPKHKNENWARRHIEAQSPVKDMIRAWIAYAVWHTTRYQAVLKNDYMMGAAWGRIGYDLLVLLNGNLGSLDGGTLDHIIRHNLEVQGFDPDI